MYFQDTVKYSHWILYHHTGTISLIGISQYLVLKRYCLHSLLSKKKKKKNQIEQQYKLAV